VAILTRRPQWISQLHARGAPESSFLPPRSNPRPAAAKSYHRPNSGNRDHVGHRGRPRTTTKRATRQEDSGNAPTNMLLLPPVSEVPLPNYSNNSCKNSSLFTCCNMHDLERNLLRVNRWQCVCRTSTCSLLVLLVNHSKVCMIH
jgi:hypothetical protein